MSQLLLDLGRIAAWLLSPLTIALALLGWNLVRHREGRASRRAMLGGAFAILWLGSLPGIAALLAEPLLSPYPAIPIAQAPSADAIVVLGGAIRGARPPTRPNRSLVAASDRIWIAAELFRAGKAPWIVIAGGDRFPQENLEPESQAIMGALTELGVPANRIRVDDRSRTTRENARYALPIVRELKARRILLVTSAQHMHRALKTFEREWDASAPVLVPFPAEVPEKGDFFTIWAWLPSPGALSFVTTTLKEYAGTAVLGII